MVLIGVTSSRRNIGVLVCGDMIFASFTYPCVEVAEEEMGIEFVNHDVLL